MATILLSAAGAAVGGAFGGSVLGLSTAVIGRAVGATLGRVIDQGLMGAGSEVVETGKLERYRLTGASEGSTIAKVYGRMRVGGQVIWSSRFKEYISTDEIGGKGVGGGATARTYTYSVSLAIALCQGKILRVGRIWADGMEVSADEFDLRFYSGSETQQPDPKIEAVEGLGNAPAYRGIAYVVFEDLELSKFGNRVPQFSFEVIRATDKSVVPENCKSLSDTIRAVAMIPGTGEYSLATTPVHYSDGFGWNRSANVNSFSGLTDFSTSLSHLNFELPICDSASLVVSWFGNDLRCAKCQLKPKVEQTEYDGKGMPWVVSGLTRSDADLVARIDDKPVYGGTPADKSVIEAIQAMRAAGKSVMFYPFILMDQLRGNNLNDPWSDQSTQAHLPWRGRITTSRAPGFIGSPDRTAEADNEVAAFFGTVLPEDFLREGDMVTYLGPDEWTYRRFILHYAHICAVAGGVDSFCIGSEMRSLTQVRGANDVFPAVFEMKRLARDVRQIVGPDVRIGYGADWSEYFGFHPDDGSGDVYFHLDPLWSDENIDFVGIDNYMPISDWRDNFDHLDIMWRVPYNIEYLCKNICGGEGYDWFYATFEDRVNQKRSEILDEKFNEPWIFRYKDIYNWWSRPHYERIGDARASESTAWLPESKPIWFTEIGCAAIDKATNQPNKFVDPKSSESEYPYFSNGLRDDYIQAQYIRAMHLYWSDSKNNPLSSVFSGRMVDMSKAHVWAWDSRPFPTFPSRLDLWDDGRNYMKGHWINGRTTAKSLAAVVSEVCEDSGLKEADVSDLYGLVRGYSVNEIASARSVIQPLSLAHGFDAAECDGVLRFRSRLGVADSEIDSQILVVSEDLDGEVEYTRMPNSELAERVRLNYIEAEGDFANRTSEAAFPDSKDHSISSSDLNMCLTSAESENIANRWLTEVRVGRDRIRFALPPSMKYVSTGDTVLVSDGGGGGIYRVDLVEQGEFQTLEAVRVERNVYVSGPGSSVPVSTKTFTPALPVYSVFLDLPLLDSGEDPIAPRIAVTANPWPGRVAVYSSSALDGYSLNKIVGMKSSFGVTETLLQSSVPGVLDRGAPLRIRMRSGVLSSTSFENVLNGRNLLAIRSSDCDGWEIFQFQNSVLVDSDTYEISERLRGQYGTDGVMPDVWPVGSTVVVLDGAPQQISLSSSERGLERHYLVGPADRSYDNRSYEHFLAAFQCVGLRPYSPVHLRANVNEIGDLFITWVRRTRIDGDNWDSFEVPLGEAIESYVVRVVSRGLVVREAFCDEPMWTYTVSARNQDKIEGAFYVQVAQISESFGPGPFERIEIDV